MSDFPHSEDGIPATGPFTSASSRPSLRAVVIQRWQPFETAPKDQTRILAFRFDRLFCVWWSGEWEGWLDDAGNPRNYDFTHWMPLPAAPAAQGGR